MPIAKAITAAEYAQKFFKSSIQKGEYSPIGATGSLVAKENTRTSYGKAHTVRKHVVVTDELRKQMPKLFQKAGIKEIEQVRQRCLRSGIPVSAFYSLEAAQEFTVFAIETHRDHLDAEFARGINRVQIETQFDKPVGFGFSPEFHNGKQLVETLVVTTFVDKPSNSTHPGALNAKFTEIEPTSYPAIEPDTGTPFVPYPPRKEFNTLVSDQGATYSNWSPPPVAPVYTSEIQNSFTATKADAAVYARIPGGVIMASHAVGLPKINDVSLVEDFDTGSVILNVNHKYKFETGLSLEELSILYESVFASGEGFVRLGATSTDETFGTDNSNIVGLTLRLADQRLGALVFGLEPFDAGFSTSTHPDYKNPAREVIGALSVSSDMQRFKRMANAEVDALTRYIFMDFSKVGFEINQSAKKISVKSVAVKLSPVVARGSQKAPEYVGGKDEFEVRYPEEMRTITHLNKNISHYLRDDPFMGRASCYSATLALLRQARRDGAKILDRELLMLSYEGRNSLVSKHASALPKSNGEVSDSYTKTAAAILERIQRGELSNEDCLHVALVGHSHSCRGNSSNLTRSFADKIKCLIQSRPSYSLDPKLVARAVDIAEGSQFQKLSFTDVEFYEEVFLNFDPDLLKKAKSLIEKNGVFEVISGGAAVDLGHKFARQGGHHFAVQMFAYGAMMPGLSNWDVRKTIDERAEGFVTPGVFAIWSVALMGRVIEGTPQEEAVLQHIASQCSSVVQASALRRGLSQLESVEWIIPIKHRSLSSIRSKLLSLC